MALSTEDFEAFLDSHHGDVSALRSTLYELSVMESAVMFVDALARLAIPHAHNRAVHALLLHRVKCICVSSNWALNRPQYCKVADRIVARIMGDNTFMRRDLIALAFDGLEKYVLAQADCALADLQEYGEAASFANYFFSPAREHMQSQYAAAEVRNVFIMQQYKESIDNYNTLYTIHANVCSEKDILELEIQEHANTDKRVAVLEAEVADLVSGGGTLPEDVLEAEERATVLETVVVAMADKFASELGDCEERLADEVHRHEKTDAEIGNMRRKNKEYTRELSAVHKTGAALRAENEHLQTQIDAMAAEIQRRDAHDLAQIKRDMYTEQCERVCITMQLDASAAQLDDAYEKQLVLESRLLELETVASTNVGVTVRVACELGHVRETLEVMLGLCDRFAYTYATRIANGVRAMHARAETRKRRLKLSEFSRRSDAAGVLQRAWREMRGREKRILHKLIVRDGFINTLKAEVLKAQHENGKAAVDKFHRLIEPLEENDKRTIALAALMMGRDMMGREGSGASQDTGSIIFGPRLCVVWDCLRVLWISAFSPDMRLAVEQFLSEYAVMHQPLAPAQLASIPFARPASREHFNMLQTQMRSGPTHSFPCGMRLLPWLRDKSAVRYTVCSNPACTSKVHHTLNRPLLYNVVCCECETVPYCSLRCLKRDKQAHKGECYILYIKSLVAKIEGHGFSPTTMVRIVLGSECLVSLGAAEVLGCRCSNCFRDSAEVKA